VIRGVTREDIGLRFESQHHVARGFSHEKLHDLCLRGIKSKFFAIFLPDFGISKNLYHRRLVTRTGGDNFSSPLTFTAEGQNYW
jgi:hypothetical protein